MEHKSYTHSYDSEVKDISGSKSSNNTSIPEVLVTESDSDNYVDIQARK
jgi:hypothetical protein